MHFGSFIFSFRQHVKDAIISVFFICEHWTKNQKTRKRPDKNTRPLPDQVTPDVTPDGWDQYAFLPQTKTTHGILGKRYGRKNHNTNRYKHPKSQKPNLWRDRWATERRYHRWAGFECVLHAASVRMIPMLCVHRIVTSSPQTVSSHSQALWRHHCSLFLDSANWRRTHLPRLTLAKNDNEVMRPVQMLPVGFFQSSMFLSWTNSRM